MEELKMRESLNGRRSGRVEVEEERLKSSGRGPKVGSGRRWDGRREIWMLKPPKAQAWRGEQPVRRKTLRVEDRESGKGKVEE